MSTIEDIASVHLGKAGDGTVVAPYQTPDAVDRSLLVAVPRSLNRVQYDLEEGDLPFVGADVWNCYEFSTLLDNGYPLSGVLKLSYSSNSDCIVESKSLKLYLNSYNMAKVAGSVEYKAATIVQKLVADDLSLLLSCKVDVDFKPYNSYSKLARPFTDYQALEHGFSFEVTQFDAYNESADLLELRDAYNESAQRLTTNALRSNCRVTNQPDWGDVFIFIDGPKHVSPISLLQYIVSMRRENHFHEEIVECIYKRLYDLLPRGTDIGVAALYTRRGGIDINPVRASSFAVLKEFDDILNVRTVSPKTSRQ